MIDTIISNNESEILIYWMEKIENFTEYNEIVTNFISNYNVSELDESLKFKICPNFKVCNQFLKNCHMDCYDNRCLNCDMVFAINLEFTTDTLHCPICLENTTNNTKMPNCDHKICNNCFKVCFSLSHSDDATYQSLSNCSYCRQSVRQPWYNNSYT